LHGLWNRYTIPHLTVLREIALTLKGYTLYLCIKLPLISLPTLKLGLTLP
jgi:hypothetical protein